MPKSPTPCSFFSGWDGHAETKGVGPRRPIPEASSLPVTVAKSSADPLPLLLGVASAVEPFECGTPEPFSWVHESCPADSSSNGLSEGEVRTHWPRPSESTSPFCRRYDKAALTAEPWSLRPN